MKLFKNIAIILALVLCMCVMFSGCSDDSEEVVNTEKNVETAAEAPENYVEFTNPVLLKAVAKCLGKEASKITEEDLFGIKYLAISPGEGGIDTVYVGLEDYADFYFSENVTIEGLQEYVKTASIESMENLSTDLGRFKGIEVFEYYNVPIDDVSFLKNYNNLYFGYFSSNGITDISSLKDYNPVTLRELDFTGNEIDDWTPVYHIKDKVIVEFSIHDMTDETGNKVSVPIVVKLSDVLSEDEEDKAADDKDAEKGDTDFVEFADDSKAPENSFESADFSALFE